MASESLDFFMDHFVDTVNGGSYSQTNNTGGVTKETKGDLFKAGYHAVEMAYYTYLYSTIYLNDEILKLYYNFEPGEARTIKLTPLAIQQDSLIIDHVTFNGQEYNEFNAREREIELAQNQGGEFLVAFRKPNKDELVTSADKTNDNINITVYPNPSSDVFTFVSNNEINNIKVYNAMGQMVLSANEHVINLASCQKGFYVAVVTHYNGKQMVKQIIKN